MRTIDYDAPEGGTGSTETHRVVDEVMKDRILHQGTEHVAYEEGFTAASGVLPEAAETGGRTLEGDRSDAAMRDREPASIRKENPGLADG